MKTVILLLVVVAAGLCYAQTDSSKNSKKGYYLISCFYLQFCDIVFSFFYAVLNNGACYKTKDCTGHSRPSVNAAECCNVYKGCSYFEPSNKQCYFCDIPKCKNGNQ